MSTGAADDPIIGTDVGGYHVNDLLGQGGMGKVYRATGPDQTKVALKLVKEDYARDETFRRRFSREARIAQTVKHPNVVPVLASGEQDGIPFMAQQFIDGETLDDKLKRDGPLDPATAVRICADVAAGLEALWGAGMVHRDIKPANILLEPDGKAFITDFGLAKDTQGSLLTLPGQALGSMDYMAPEQIRGEEVGAATDIYALGCVMYECMCGRPPFADVQGMRILWAHLQDPPPDPLTLRSDLPEAFAKALLTALEKEREKRPARAGAYAEMLAEAAGSATDSESATAASGSTPASPGPAAAPPSTRDAETRISDASAHQQDS
jgi:serine/threonine-protein kinase